MDAVNTATLGSTLGFCDRTRSKKAEILSLNCLLFSL